MATTKTINVTNQTVSVPEFTDRPDARVYSDAEGKLVDGVNANTQAIANTNSKITEQNTNDVLTNAAAITDDSVHFYKGSGASYTGTLPHDDFKYGSFIVTCRGNGYKFVLAQSYTNRFAVNTYANNAWAGWNDITDKIANNSRGTTVNLDSYTSSDYTFLSDGYITAVVTNNSQSNAIAQVKDSSGTNFFRIGGYGNSTYATYAAFVRKGMKVRTVLVENSGHITFEPFS